MRGSIINKTATGQKIRDRMDEVGIDVRGINMFFDFTSPTIFYYWRRGTKMPTLEHLAVLAAILGVSMSEIVVADTSAYPIRAKGPLRTYKNGSIAVARDLLVPSSERTIISNINIVATGERIRQLMFDARITIRDMQEIFGFKTPQAIYKWVNGNALPTVEHLAILAATLGVPMDEIVIVGIIVLSMPEGRVLSFRDDIQVTEAAIVKLLRAQKAEM